MVYGLYGLSLTVFELFSWPQKRFRPPARLLDRRRRTKKEMGGIFRGASEQGSAKGSSGYPTSFPRPVDHTYWAYERRNPESNHTAPKNGKEAVPDEIPADALKVDANTSVEILYSLFMKIWEKNEVPAEWKKGYLIKLTKKEISVTQSVFKLQRNNTAVHPWYSFQQSSAEHA